MKSIFTALLLLVITTGIQAQTMVIKITGTKFPFAIMQQWIDAYTAIHPGIQFELSKSIPADSADLFIATHAFRPGELKDDEAIVAVNRYAQLPIVNSRRPNLAALQQKGLTQKDMANIFFAASATKSTANNSPFTIYKRDKNVCATRSFAENITGAQADINGANVNGDDRALTAAVKNDLNGISYNNLGLIYNIITRQVADSLAIIPIDLNENGKIDANENQYANLDQVLDFIVRTKSAKIPQDNVNILFHKNSANKNALAFLDWIITKGQQYNRQFGFLSIEKELAKQQQNFIFSTMLYGSNASATGNANYGKQPFNNH